VSAGVTAGEVIAALARLGDAEVYLKSGRTRRLHRGLGGEEQLTAMEEGWAVRAGDRRSSFFLAGSGPLQPPTTWPQPDGLPVQLPDPAPVLRWSEPTDLAAPLLSEREAQSFLGGVGDALAAELAGARLDEATLEEGASESQLESSRGVRASWRQRVAWVRLAASLPEAGVRATFEQGAREAKRLQPRTLARALADRLSVLAKGKPPQSPLAEAVLAPAVAGRLLSALVPLLVGPDAAERVAPWLDGERRLASPLLSIVDDGRLPGGLLSAPVDGEGVPTRALKLVDAGVYRQPLLAWWQSRGSGLVGSGCTVRASWRDLPRPGPTHLFVAPREGVRPADLVATLESGCYLLDVTGPLACDLTADRFALPVCGFLVGGGAARGALAGAWLRGRVSALLHGIAGVARDLTFLPSGGLVGSPTLLVRGVEVGAER
jgi:PmbA protein